MLSVLRVFDVPCGTEQFCVPQFLVDMTLVCPLSDCYPTTSTLECLILPAPANVLLIVAKPVFAAVLHLAPMTCWTANSGKELLRWSYGRKEYTGEQ